MYEALVARIRYHIQKANFMGLKEAESTLLLGEAADAIEELLKAAKSMHTWIFLNSGDEQAAYEECGLTDEMNVALGYGGKIILEPPKEE